MHGPNGPVRCGFFGEQLLGPTLMAFGTNDQRERFLGPILRAEELWCQGFSEPDAGSDLANIKTAAVMDGDQWRITGQKLWTSLGHIADWIFLVCRTGHDKAAKHRGSLPALPNGPTWRRAAAHPAVDRHVLSSTRSSSTTPAPTPPWWSARSAAVGRSSWAHSASNEGTAFLAQQLRFGSGVQDSGGRSPTSRPPR